MIMWKKISVSQGDVGRDYANLWDLENGNFLAFLADAPSHAEQRSGMYVKNFLNNNVESIIQSLQQKEYEEIELVMADLMTAIGDELFKIGKGSAYSTLCLVLVFNEYLYALSVGDSVIYVLGKTKTRISEITRLNGKTVFSGVVPDEPTRYAEYSYIGSSQKYFTRKHVWRLPSDGIKWIALVSDGAETQFGVKRLLQMIEQGDTIDKKEQALQQQLNSKVLKDDVTVLLAEVAVKHSSNLASRFRADMVKLHESLGNINSQFNQYKAEIKNAIESLNGDLMQKVTKKEIEESHDDLKKSFEIFRNNLDTIIEQKIKKNIEDDSADAAIRRLMDRMSAMVEDKTRDFLTKLGEITRKMDSLLHQYVENPVNKKDQVTLAQYIEAMVNLKSTEYLNSVDLNSVIKREIAGALAKMKAQLTADRIDVSPFSFEKKKGKMTFLDILRKPLWAVLSVIVIAVAIFIIFFSLGQSSNSTQSQLNTKSEIVQKENPVNSTMGKYIALGQKEKDIQKRFFEDTDSLEVYIAHFYPKIRRKDKNGHRIEEPVKLIANYPEFKKLIDDNSKNTLLLPIPEAKKHWQDMEAGMIKSYQNKKYDDLTLDKISELFLINGPDFLNLLKTQNLKEAEVIKNGASFPYHSFFYKIKMKKQLSVQQLSDLLDLSEEELQKYNPELDFNQCKDKYINIPINREPPKE